MNTKEDKKRILFLCSKNSCRSQMAEALGRALGPRHFHFQSAGLEKSEVNPRAVTVMAELGVDLSSHVSKSLAEVPLESFDVLITVCSGAHESCPVLPGKKVVHLGFDDPPYLTREMKDEAEIMPVYRRVRDEIKEVMLNFQSHLEGT